MPNRSSSNDRVVATGTPQTAYSDFESWFGLANGGMSTTSWQVRRQDQQAETLAATAADVAETESADDTNFALEGESVEAAPMDEGTGIVPRPPSDVMVPHESDTSLIRRLRADVVRGDETNRSLLDAITPTIREMWYRSHTEPAQPPSEAPTLRRTERRMGSHSHSFSGQFSGETSRRISPREENSQNFFGNIPETASMTTIARIIGHRVTYPTIEKHPLIVGTNLAGVEIELEDLSFDTNPTFRYWTAKGDGSLRNNGMEFVCSSPWGGIDLYNAAIEIDKFLFENTPDATWRCSTHVHVDVRDMTVSQLKKMILAYVFYERVLFRCSGWHRYKNNFCMAMGFAQDQLSQLANWWAKNDQAFINSVLAGWDKYTAINLLPMGNFGSVEFRISEAKSHKGQIIRLVNRFLSLKEVAIERDNLSEEEFIDSLMSSELTDVIRKGIPKGLGDVQADLEVGYKLAYDIVSIAKIRRRNITQFVPNITDGSRVVENVQVFMNGWQHCVSRLRPRHPTIEFPDHPGSSFTFAWIYELQRMMSRTRHTFDVTWFLPEQNRSQLLRLYNEYKEARDNGLAGPNYQTGNGTTITAQPVAPAVPQPRSIFEDDDSDEEIEDDEEYGEPDW